MRVLTTEPMSSPVSFRASTLVLCVAVASLLFAMFAGDRLHGDAADTTMGIAFFFLLPVCALLGAVLSAMNLLRMRRVQFGVELTVALLLIWMMAVTH